MGRFFIEPWQLKDGFVTIIGQDAKHLAKVLRLGPGTEVEVFDGSGVDYLVKLVTVTLTESMGEILGQKRAATEPPLKINLVQALPKQGKMELIIQKCTELGIMAIYPIETQRTVVKLAADKSKEKTERWQKIAVEAVKQCGRSIIPQISPPQSLAVFLNTMASNQEIIMFWEGETTQGLKKLLTKWESQAEKPELFIIIGPEGGFTAEEAEQVLKCGGHLATLGPRILRTETAGIAVLSSIMYHLGDLGG